MWEYLIFEIPPDEADWHPGRHRPDSTGVVGGARQLANCLRPMWRLDKEHDDVQRRKDNQRAVVA